MLKLHFKKDLLSLYFSPQWRAFLGLNSFVLYFFTYNLYFKFFLLFIFFLLALLSAKRIDIIYFLSFGFFIVFFGLLNPAGEVLYKFHYLIITKIALLTSLMRALNLTGFIFISLFSVHKDLKLPTALGRDFSKLLLYFNYINESREDLRRKNFLSSVDKMLFSAFERVKNE